MTKDEKNNIITSIKRLITLHNLNTPNRKPQKAFQRFYLFNIMYYTLNMSDTEIGYYFNLNRSSVLSGRKKAYDFEQQKDPLFLSSTNHIKNVFPFISLKEDKTKSVEKYAIPERIKFSKETFLKLKDYKEKHGIHLYKDAIEQLINIVL